MISPNRDAHAAITPPPALPCKPNSVASLAILSSLQQKKSVGPTLSHLWTHFWFCWVSIFSPYSSSCQSGHCLKSEDCGATTMQFDDSWVRSGPSLNYCGKN